MSRCEQVKKEMELTMFLDDCKTPKYNAEKNIQENDSMLSALGSTVVFLQKGHKAQGCKPKFGPCQCRANEQLKKRSCQRIREQSQEDC